VSPAATARACLLAATKEFKGHEIFNIVAPDTTQDIDTEELARKYCRFYLRCLPIRKVKVEWLSVPNVPLKEDLPGKTSFFTSKKAEDMLGWTHEEKE